MDSAKHLLSRFEAGVGLGPTKAARLLGMPYVTYAQWRSGIRHMKVCHVYHVEVLMMLEPKTLRKRIREVVDD